MKRWEIDELVARLRAYRQIRSIFRVDDTTVRIDFARDVSYVFAMRRGAPLIWPVSGYLAAKRYASPFDVTLTRRCAGARIVSVGIVGDDRIIRFELSASQGYKSQTTFLQFELTGRHVNVIVMDADETVLEAMRHIDEAVSVRPVRVGERLMPPPRPAQMRRSPVPQEYDGNIDGWLARRAGRENDARLAAAKQQHRTVVERKLAVLAGIASALPSEERLARDADAANRTGQILLIHIGELRPYVREVTLPDFEGVPVVIALPAVKTAAQMPEYYFRLSRKLRQKGRHTHIERDNLSAKIAFMRRLLDAIDTAGSLEELAVLFPPREARREKKGEKTPEWETFSVEGYRVLVGKSEAGNVALLKQARAGDVWLHLKDRPGAHVVVPTAKEQIPDAVLREAARLCARFSVDGRGSYEVNYTARRNVKPKEKANCLYVNYKTVKVDI